MEGCLCLKIWLVVGVVLVVDSYEFFIFFVRCKQLGIRKKDVFLETTIQRVNFFPSFANGERKLKMNHITYKRL